MTGRFQETKKFTDRFPAMHPKRGRSLPCPQETGVVFRPAAAAIQVSGTTGKSRPEPGIDVSVPNADR